MAFRLWQESRRPIETPDSIVSYLDAIVRATDIETVWALLCRFSRSYGFSDVIYGYSPNSRGSIPGSREDFLLLSTLNRDLMEAFVDKGYYRESITVNWALDNAGVASWSMTSEEAQMDGFVSSDESLVFFSKFFGTQAGCTIGFPTASTRGRAVMALIAEPGRTQEEVDAGLTQFSDALFVVATVAHRAMIAMPYLGAKRSLTRRQREVLEWIAEGKSVADIARILNLAQPTIEKHLKLARETLGVETTAHAVIKAAFLNQMFVLLPQSAIESD
jgi:LuxR family transcriptional regulator